MTRKTTCPFDFSPIEIRKIVKSRDGNARFNTVRMYLLLNAYQTQTLTVQPRRRYSKFQFKQIIRYDTITDSFIRLRLAHNLLPHRAYRLNF